MEDGDDLPPLPDGLVSPEVQQGWALLTAKLLQLKSKNPGCSVAMFEGMLQLLLDKLSTDEARENFPRTIPQVCWSATLVWYLGLLCLFVAIILDRMALTMAPLRLPRSGDFARSFPKICLFAVLQMMRLMETQLPQRFYGYR